MEDVIKNSVAIIHLIREEVGEESDACRQRRRQGGAEGAQAPLSDQNIDVYFLSFSPSLYCKSRTGALQNVLWQYHRRSNAFVIKPSCYEFSRFEKY